MEQIAGNARLVQQLSNLQCCQRSKRIRLEHHTIARQQCRNRIGGRQCQRIVPRCDNPHHAMRNMLLNSVREHG